MLPSSHPINPNLTNAPVMDAIASEDVGFFFVNRSNNTTIQQTRRGLARFHHSGQSHFVTLCCYHRRRLFTTDASRRIFESALEGVRRTFRLHVYGYVVMPDHVHLLLSEPQQDTLADALKSLKQGVSRRLIGDADHFWQKRYYDFNIRNHPQFVEKLRYIHRNPVKAGLSEGVEQLSPLRNRL